MIQDLFSGSAAWFVLGGLATLIVAIGIWRLARWISRLKRAQTPLPERALAVSIEEHWPVWETSISNALLQHGWVDAYLIPSIPLHLHLAALRRYYEEHSDEALILQETPPRVELANRERLRRFLHNWKAAWELTESEQPFNEVITDIAVQFCDVLGFILLPGQVRTYQSLHAFMVRAPALRLKVPPHFPIVFVRRREGKRQDVSDLRNLMSILDVNSYFALIVDLNDFADRLEPSRNLKHLVSDMIHDFIILNGQDLRRILIAKDPGQRMVELMLQQVDLTVVSPYVTSGPVPENMFFGRDYELKTITRKIDQTSFAIIGGRKIGKTSILAKVHRLLSESDPERLVLYLDCQAVVDHTGFFEAANASWAIAHSVYTPESLRYYLIHQKKKGDNRPAIILLDEIDAILSSDAAQSYPLFRVFRALSQENHARFVICGERVLYAQLHDAQSPLFNLSDVLQLGNLKPQATRQIVLEPMRMMGISLQQQEQMLAEIMHFSSCHPNITQYLCQQLIYQANTRHSRLVTPVDLATVRHASEFHEYLIEVTWGNSTPLERIITVLIADLGPLTLGQLQQTLSDKEMGVPQESLERAIAGLRLSNIVGKKGTQHVLVSEIMADILHESQETEILLSSLRTRLRNQAKREGWRPTW